MTKFNLFRKLSTCSFIKSFNSLQFVNCKWWATGWHMVGLHSGWVGASYNMPRAFYDLYIIIVYTVVIQSSLLSSSALSCPKQLPTELFTLDFIDWEEPWTNWMMMQQFQNSISATMGLNYFCRHIFIANFRTKSDL